MNQHTSFDTVASRTASGPTIVRSTGDHLKDWIATVATLIVSAGLTFAWTGLLIYVLLLLYF